jgi:hypothetical protein
MDRHRRPRPARAAPAPQRSRPAPRKRLDVVRLSCLPRTRSTTPGNSWSHPFESGARSLAGSQGSPLRHLRRRASRETVSFSSPVQSSVQRARIANPKPVNLAVARDFEMARPGLEPGTPRFQSCGSNSRPGSKRLQISGIQAARPIVGHPQIPVFTRGLGRRVASRLPMRMMAHAGSQKRSRTTQTRATPSRTQEVRGSSARPPIDQSPANSHLKRQPQ